MTEYNYYLSNKRFYILALVLFLMFFGIMLLFYLKADEVTKHPCQVCSKTMGEEIICTGSGLNKMQVTFYPNLFREDAALRKPLP